MKFQQQTWLVVLALVLAGCGSAQPGAVEATPGSGGPTDSTAPTTTTVDAAEDSLTLADYFGYGGDPDEQQALQRQQDAEIQESIRSCMAEEGFDYIPVTYPEQSFDFEFDQREFVETQGFGISTWYFQEEEFFGGEEDFFIDPNQDMVEAMSDGEREAYYEALYGDQSNYEPTYDEETGEEIFEFEGFGSGCDGQAYEAIYGQTDAVYSEFGPELEEMFARVESDPRIVEMQAGWSSCMAAAGYEFDDQEDMYDWLFTDFQQQVDEVIGQVFVDPFEGWSQSEIDEFFASKTDEEIEAFFRESEQQSRADVDEVALGELNKQEIAMAIADFDCFEGFEEIYAEVSAEYEADFVRENRTRLDELRGGRGDG